MEFLLVRLFTTPTRIELICVLGCILVFVWFGKGKNASPITWLMWLVSIILVYFVWNLIEPFLFNLIGILLL